MPVLEDGSGWDFLRRQVLTSRNVTGGPVVTVALGGLNYQIEHHLFPSMPSQNLHRARPLVRRFCARAGPAVRRDHADRVLPAGTELPAQRAAGHRRLGRPLAQVQNVSCRRKNSARSSSDMSLAVATRSK